MNDKKALHLSVNVLSTKSLIEDMISTIFTSPTGDRTVILRGHLSHMKDQYPLTSQREYLHNNNNTLYLKRVTQKLSYFKTLSIGPALGIKPATSRSVVKCSPNWAKLAVVNDVIFAV